MSINQINLAAYNQFTDGQTLSAATFNALVTSIQSKINEIVLNENTASPSVVEAFKVNGNLEHATNGVVTLASKGTYRLTGCLTGRIVIGASTDTWTDGESSPTVVILDGCTIINGSGAAAIEYAPSNDKMIVTIRSNKYNYIQCTEVADRADGQKGAIHSENDLIVQGCGYLSIETKCGHGIKASEVRLSGNPHLYISAIHDGVHGNKLVAIDGGLYYIAKANDGFGTRAESGTAGSADYKSPGKILIFGGEFYAYSISEKVFDSKAPGYIFSKNVTINTKEVPNVPNTQATGILLHTNSLEANHYSGITNVDPQTYFGTATVTGATLSGNTYTATGAAVTIKGYFKDVNFVFPTKSTELTLDGAYIETNTASAIKYTYDGKNIKVKASKDTVNIIKTTGEGNYCIESINNIAIEPKNNGFLMLESESNAITGSEITIRDGFGEVIVKKGGIVGSQLSFGEALTKFGGAIIAPKASARLSGKGQKGNIIVDSGFIGIAYIDEIESAGLANMASNKNILYHKLSGSTFMNDCGIAKEPYDYVKYKDGTPDII